MPNYYFTTVIQQTIPNADMSPLERLLLTHIFEWEQDDEGLYFFASEGSCDMICVSRYELEAAISASEEYESSVISVVKDGLAETPEAESDTELDFSMTSWEPILQDIVRRSSTLTQITAMTAFTCSKMRPDGFGGMAILITADVILGKTTDDILCELMDQAEKATLAAASGVADSSAARGELPAAG
jgi:hypothetical protein